MYRRPRRISWLIVLPSTLALDRQPTSAWAISGSPPSDHTSLLILTVRMADRRICYRRSRRASMPERLVCFSICSFFFILFKCRLPAGHPNIVTLYDYFEVLCSSPAVYKLATDAYRTPSDHAQSISMLRSLYRRRTFWSYMRKRKLLRRVRARLWSDRGSPQLSFRDAAGLVRTIIGAVAYIHEKGIVHRGTSRLSVVRG